MADGHRPGYSIMEQNKMAAFRAFDLSRDGTINYFELSMALMGCDAVRAAVGNRDLRQLEIEEAAEQAGAEMGGLVTYAQYSRICDIVVQNFTQSSTKAYEQQLTFQRFASAQQALSNAMVVAGEGGMPPTSPLRYAPPEDQHQALVTSAEHFPELGPIQRAFFMFDIDQSGAVTFADIPGMLEILGVVPKPAGDKKAAKAFDEKWRRLLTKELPYPKEVGDLINVRDFHDLALLMAPKLKREFPERPKPPPPPRDPSPPGSPPGSPGSPEPEKTASELAREEAERLEQERIRLEEEARAAEEAAKRAAERRLYLQLPNGAIFTVEDNSEYSKVNEVIQKVADCQGIHPGQVRLVFSGYEMNPKKTLGDFGVRPGHPQEHKGTVVRVLLRDHVPGTDPSGGRPPATEVYAMLPDGMQLTLLCKLDESIADQMRKIEAAACIPYPVMRLICNGREISPLDRLRDAGVCAFDTLYVLRRDVA